MRNTLSLEDTIKRIESGEKLFISGEGNLLRKLPRGNWVGGSIPYFMTSEGGLLSKELLLIQSIPPEVEEIRIKRYSVHDISQFPQDSYSNGFSFILIPGFSEIHRVYARECWNWSKFFDHPVFGWITGHALDEKVAELPIAVNGLTGEITESDAIILHAKLKSEYFAKVETINLFRQGSGDTIQFIENSFEVKECLINGQKKNFLNYILEKNINIKLPLVASYLGTNVNVSIKELNTLEGKVGLYTPTFEGLDYRQAQDIGEYETSFMNELLQRDQSPFFSCNCILNYLYASLEGKKLGRFSGPMTFGEVAYKLLNQTYIYATIEKK